jgi:hypothetical protein
MPQRILALPATKPQRPRAAGAFFCALPIFLALPGCAVVTVASTAVSITAGAVGLAADAAIGTVKIVGKGVGKAADAMMDDDSSAPPQDASGLQIRYRDPSLTPPTAPATPSSYGAATHPEQR